MTLRAYIEKLRMATMRGEADEEQKALLRYAIGAIHGDEGLDKYRSKEISIEIGKRYSIDDQIAIGFNQHIDSLEYDAFQAFRAKCKRVVDERMAENKAKLEKILVEEVYRWDSTP